MRLLTLSAVMLLWSAAHAQTTISGQIYGVKPDQVVTLNVPVDCWTYPQNAQKITPDRQGRFSAKVPVRQPQLVFLTYADKTLHLYAEPGKALSLQADSALTSVRFGGSLGHENGFRQHLGLTTYTLGKQTWNDSLSKPAQILADLQQAQQRALAALKTIPFKPSPSFLRMTQADIRYFAASKLWDLIWRNGVWTSKNKSRYDQSAWREASKKSHQAIALSDSTALTSYHYQLIIAYYPHYLEHLASSKAEFIPMAEAVFKRPFEEVNQAVRQHGDRYWEYAALNYGLTGRALQRAIASFLINGIYQGDLDYQEEAYADFRKRFPRSAYLPHVQEVMKPYLASLSANKMDMPGIHFIPDSQRIATLDSLLAAHRGRVVYIDMWGTWCGPCRQEFAYNQALKERFKGKAVDFVYLAVEHRPNPEKHWQDMVAFYQLTGAHVLAGKELEQDLRKRYDRANGLQFPSYILVDKAGNIVTLHGKRPSDQEALYGQIEQLL